MLILLDSQCLTGPWRNFWVETGRTDRSYRSNRLQPKTDGAYDDGPPSLPMTELCFCLAPHSSPHKTPSLIRCMVIALTQSGALAQSYDKDKNNLSIRE